MKMDTDVQKKKYIERCKKYPWMATLNADLEAAGLCRRVEDFGPPHYERRKKVWNKYFKETKMTHMELGLQPIETRPTDEAVARALYDLNQEYDPDSFSCIHVPNEHFKTIRAALMAYKPLPKINDKIRERIGIAIGEASMCWDEMPHGVFDSERATRIVNELCEYLKHSEGE